MSRYIIASGVLFSLMFGTWSRDGFLNIAFKFMFLGFFVWALFVYFGHR